MGKNPTYNRTLASYPSLNTEPSISRKESSVSNNCYLFLLFSIYFLLLISVTKVV